jgi:hypothetical protein
MKKKRVEMAPIDELVTVHLGPQPPLSIWQTCPLGFVCRD